MVAAAKALGVTAQVMDGQTLTFIDEFDAVFSNAALHWMTCPKDVIAGVWRALKPGGRFVAESADTAMSLPLLPPSRRHFSREE